MKRLLFVTAIAIAVTSPAYAQDAGFTPVLTEEPPIIVTGRRPVEFREEWREPATVVDDGMFGAQRFTYTVPLATIGDGQLQFHREWSRHRPGGDYGPPERDDDTLRLVFPFPLSD